MSLINLVTAAYSNETVTLRKHVIKYKNLRKLMSEFLRKVVNRGCKIARVNPILISKSIYYSYLLQFCTVLGSVVIEGDCQCSVHLLRSLCLNIIKI